MSDWRHRAACRDENSELFFPVGDGGPAQLQTMEAKAVCCRCPVMGECLSWAMATGQDHGVWGGLSESERRKMRRRYQRSGTAPEPTPARAEGPVLNLARTKGARIVRMWDEGYTPSVIAQKINSRAGDIRQAYELVTTGQIEPLPETPVQTRRSHLTGAR